VQQHLALSGPLEFKFCCPRYFAAPAARVNCCQCQLVLPSSLQAALELGCKHIKVLGDSTLIIKQVLGEFQVKNEGLKPYHRAALGLSQQFKTFDARQVPRCALGVLCALCALRACRAVCMRCCCVWVHVCMYA
jgi:hypothetical protein